MRSIVPPSVLVILLLPSCLSLGGGEGRDIQKVLNEACFEVVLRKPEVDSLSYERPLPLDALSYNLRKDDYYSIGTAFAIDNGLFVTAAHVLSLRENSRYFKEYFLRDQGGQIYPIGDLRSFDNAKDFVVFNVPGLEAKTTLKVRLDFQPNEAVYQVGNIYGQGVVAVPATLVGTLPESRDGSWEHIKTAPPNDRGTSGGPLLDKDFNVIGLIIQKDQNFSYSLPLREVDNSEKEKGFIADRYTYGFNLTPNVRTALVPFDLEIALPLSLEAVKTKAQEEYKRLYSQHMKALFDSLEGEFFLEGQTSDEALYNSSTPNSFQVFFRDDSDGRWYLSNLDKKSGRLKDEGWVYYSSLKNGTYIDLVKPQSISHGELYKNPKLVMDLVFEGFRIPRKFADQEIRITSLGEPYQVETYEDRYRRKWILGYWSMEYADRVAMFAYTLVPDGITGILNFVDSSEIYTWVYDTKVIMDMAYIPYTGSLKEWEGFLAEEEALYGLFEDMEIRYSEGESLKMTSSFFEVNLPEGPLEITEDMNLAIYHGLIRQGEEVRWLPRKFVIGNERDDSFVMVNRFQRPWESLPKKYKTEWANFQEEKNPYSKEILTSEGLTSIGGIHPQFTGPEEFSFSLYYARGGTNHNQETMLKYWELLGASINIF